MWLFLATEVMFFGGLLTAYRGLPDRRAPGESRWPADSSTSCSGASIRSSFLTSSLTMALAVRAAQLRARRELVRWLVLTMVLGTVFLGIKAVE